jgi:hypothetical protein
MTNPVTVPPVNGKTHCDQQPHPETCIKHPGKYRGVSKTVRGEFLTKVFARVEKTTVKPVLCPEKCMVTLSNGKAAAEMGCENMPKTLFAAPLATKPDCECHPWLQKCAPGPETGFWRKLYREMASTALREFDTDRPWLLLCDTGRGGTRVGRRNSHTLRKGTIHSCVFGTEFNSVHAKEKSRNSSLWVKKAYRGCCYIAETSFG